jgi:tRNA 5-methylaminomethyl-2-thiouridine biosynthesis bifunctional protein
MGFMPDVPRSEEFDDVYFNSEDGPGETAYVFFDGNNLPAAWQGAERFVIGETGFGTGLNFLLAWQLFDRTAPKGAMLDYVSVEKYPLSVEQIKDGLSQFSERLSPYLEKFLSKYPLRVPGFHRIVFDGRVSLTLIFDDAGEALSEMEGQVDAWFLDGFTPSRNPDMWTDKIFTEIGRLSHKGTTLSTFTSAGFVKRGLRAVGFEMKKRQGFGFKWSMLTGVFDGAEKQPSHGCKTVSIVGAGLAGCAAAYVLPQYGFAVSVYDPNGVASGASGNSAGILNPRLSAFRTAESDYHTAAFAMAAREFQHFDAVDYDRCGSLHLVTDEEKKYRRANENWGWNFAHMQYLSAKEASDIAGVPINHDALYLPDAGKINPARLCASYIKDMALEKIESDVTVFAHGAAIPSDPSFAWLPLQTVRGQITTVKSTPQSESIKTNLCYGGYISPAHNGEHVLGSTFQKWLDDIAPRDEDDASNIEKLQAILPCTAFETTGHRAALRCAAQDRFPVIGPVPDSDNAYLTTAYGSHGITGSLLGAHILADYLRGGPFCVGKSTLKALAPARFKLREMRRSGENL